MKRLTSLLLVLGLMAPAQAAPPSEKVWVRRSNAFTRKALKIEMEHSPEQGSAQGLRAYDERISTPTRADEQLRRQQLEVVVKSFAAALRVEKDARVAQDLQILLDAFHLAFRQEDFARAHYVTFQKAGREVYSGLRCLLDEQVAKERRPAALVRLRKYAGLEPGFRPIVEHYRAYTLEQIARPGVTYPTRAEILGELQSNSSYISGVQALFEKYHLQGWQQPLKVLRRQLEDYDAWVRREILPRARPDFRESPEQYALDLESYGIDLEPHQITSLAHTAFRDIQAEMEPLAVQIATARHLLSSNYRDVIRELKKEQIPSEAILPLYQSRLAEIEQIIRLHNIVELPDRPALIRLANAAETAQQPAPHMAPPPFVQNNGQRGVFVLPLNIPGGAKYDDFTFNAAAWTLTAHEARPGHELQFDSMVEQQVTLARALYAFNSTNVEGWGLYSEWLIQPYMPAEAQLICLDHRLLRAARAFLDPELQMGLIQPEEASRVLREDVVLSAAAVSQEVERYTIRSPGQSTSYFFGFLRLIELRRDVEALMGSRFEQKKFHDFVLSQGLLPPKLMRKAVLDHFNKKVRSVSLGRMS